MVPTANLWTSSAVKPKAGMLLGRGHRAKPTTSNEVLIARTEGVGHKHPRLNQVVLKQRHDRLTPGEYSGFSEEIEGNGGGCRGSYAPPVSKFPFESATDVKQKGSNDPVAERWREPK